MNDVESVVASGAERFDGQEPRWVWSVNLGTLDMDVYSLCVFGQVMGEEISYHHFGDFGNDEWNESHGFDNSYGISSRDLHDAWTDLILERRKSK